MRTHRINRDIADRADTVFVRPDRSGPASIHFLNSQLQPGRYNKPIHDARMPRASWNEMAELKVDVDGRPVRFRLLIEDTGMQSSLVSNNADVHALLSGTLEKIVDRMRGPSLRRDTASNPPPAAVAAGSEESRSAQPPVSAKETVLRVGPLELDLLERTAKRGDRQLDLRPREYQLLKYMMERSDKLLTRATLFMEVWHYKFVPNTNLVDVHMGRLRRKVDGQGEAIMIRCVRGEGFVLSARPLSPQ